MVNIRKTNTKVIFDKGRFDDYCVYICKQNLQTAPRDIDYFTFFKKLQNQHSNDIDIYLDYVSIYNRTNQNFDQNVITHIHQLVDKYIDILPPNDLQELEKYYVVIYMTMIAEENKKKY